MKVCEGLRWTQQLNISEAFWTYSEAIIYSEARLAKTRIHARASDYYDTDVCPTVKDPAIPFVESVLAYAANGFLDLLSEKVLQ